MLYFAKWKTTLILLVCLIGMAMALPNVMSKSTLSAMPDWLPHKSINLGLDLQGGSHLLLELKTSDVIIAKLDSVIDSVRASMRSNKIGYSQLRKSTSNVSLTIRKPEQVEKAYQLLRALAQPVSSSLLGQFGQGGTLDLNVSRQGTSSIKLELSEVALRQQISNALDLSIEIIRRRIDELGTTEPTIQRQGENRIIVQVPGLDDPERLKQLIGQTAKLVFRLVDTSISPQQALSSRAPVGSEILYTYVEKGSNTPKEPYVVKKRVMVSGERLVDAQPGFDQRTNRPIVNFRFDSSGAKRFGRATQVNVGRPFAIVLDNEVVSAPVIQEAILGGSGQISGQFSVQEVNNLAILMRSGALPAKLTIVEERSVGPGLGADSIAAGKLAAILGMIAVVVFIVLSYGLFGIFANIALAVNILLIAGILSFLQATLTLPGIAGIVLTIGMAVDANVLIYERIREEARAGKTPIAAIDAGYSRALGTILDANITTFLAAIILFQLGSGPVRGFAVTLAIGIVTSVFTAFTLTRLLISWWVRTRRPAEIPI